MDVPIEIVASLFPLFLSSVLEIKTYIIGVMEGVAESTASLLNFFRLAFRPPAGQ